MSSWLSRLCLCQRKNCLSVLLFKVSRLLIHIITGYAGFTRLNTNTRVNLSVNGPGPVLAVVVGMVYRVIGPWPRPFCGLMRASADNVLTFSSLGALVPDPSYYYIRRWSWVCFKMVDAYAYSVSFCLGNQPAECWGCPCKCQKNSVRIVSHLQAEYETGIFFSRHCWFDNMLSEWPFNPGTAVRLQFDKP